MDITKAHQGCCVCREGGFMQSGSQQRLSLRSDGWMLTGSERIRTCNQVEWNDVKAREVSQTSSYSVCPPPSCRRTLVFHPGVPCCYAFVCIIGFFLLMNHTLLRAQLVFICSLSLVKLSSPVRTTITGSAMCSHCWGLAIPQEGSMGPHRG